MPAGPTGRFEAVASDTRYVGFSTVRVDTLRTPDGRQVEREIVEHAGVVAMVPVLDDRAVLLVRQYRHALGDYLLEIPAGTLDVAGEPPDRAAQRELVEEVSHRATTLTLLGSFHNSAGWSTELTHLYLATGLAPAAPPDDYAAPPEERDMRVVRIPLDEAVGRAGAGELTDAKTALGLLLAGQRVELLPGGSSDGP